MNFDDAIKVHTFWKVTLRWLINGHKPVDVMHADSPTQCALGGWIIGEGLQHKDIPAYQVLVDAHCEFHRVAGEVVKACDAGLNDAAQSMLAPDGAFSVASNKTIQAIKDLKATVEAKP